LYFYIKYAFQIDLKSVIHTKNNAQAKNLQENSVDNRPHNQHAISLISSIKDNYHTNTTIASPIKPVIPIRQISASKKYNLIRNELKCIFILSILIK